MVPQVCQAHQVLQVLQVPQALQVLHCLRIPWNSYFSFLQETIYCSPETHDAVLEVEILLLLVVPLSPMYPHVFEEKIHTSYIPLVPS